ncbi:MAG: elongation factor G-binding protein, partial [Levilactobacillus sp.]|nr:elongation factor G-binding protein [Levilactobacillus sp.]
MKPTITAYEYSYISQQLDALVSAYLSVNDKHMRRVVRDTTLERIKPLLPLDEPLVQDFLTRLQPDRLTRKAAAEIVPLLEP